MIKTANLPDLAAELLATLGDTYTVNGDACSPYFTLVLNTETQADISVSLIDERANLPRKEWGYAMHVIDDISGEPWEIPPDDGPREPRQKFVRPMGGEILPNKPRFCITAVRLPTIEEWARAVKAVKGENSILHWNKVLSWCQDTDSDCPTFRSARGGFHPGDHCHPYYTHRGSSVGFRPVFEGRGFSNIPDGSIIPAVATLFMNGHPVKVPTSPFEGGDIPAWAPGITLKFGDPLDIPSYQVSAIKAGNILVADQVLLTYISWEDLERQGFHG